ARGNPVQVQRRDAWGGRASVVDGAGDAESERVLVDGHPAARITSSRMRTLCLGEALVDLIAERRDAFVPHFGGATANIAVRAARAMTPGGSGCATGSSGRESTSRCSS